MGSLCDSCNYCSKDVDSNELSKNKSYSVDSIMRKDISAITPESKAILRHIKRDIIKYENVIIEDS